MLKRYFAFSYGCYHSMNKHTISRRDFLKFIAIAASGLSLGAWKYGTASSAEFPQYDRLGRVCVGKIDVKIKPDQDSETIQVLYEDAVVPWLREIVGRKPYYINQRWVETDGGYIYASYLQPVRNLPNPPVTALIETSMGSGIWVEVTVPYAYVILQSAPSSHSWVEAKTEEGLPIRIYYGQVFWVDQIKTDDQGWVYYRVNPNYYGGVDMFWAPSESFRPIAQEELLPISPEITDKRVEVNLLRQTVSCFEGKDEVNFFRVSTGAKYDAEGNPVDKWSTPVGTTRISRKYLSLQMSGGTTGAGYDLPGIGWTSIFATGGVALHATVWHNDFGVPRSHGCVNLLPEDAKWIYRWTMPVVPYDPGMVDISLSGDASTTVQVIES